MRLSRALRVTRGEVVAFTGAGGKTTAMFRLAGELAAQGWHVITTTTTRLAGAQVSLFPCHLVAEQLEPLLDALPDLLRRHGQVLVYYRPLPAEDKVAGIPPGWVKAIAGLDAVDIVLVEADGARGRPFKAPASHEPVVPDAATLLVPMVGVDATGAPLDHDHVHRAAEVAELAGVRPGGRLTVEALARVLTHPAGGLKGRPPGCRVVPLINKVETSDQQAVAEELAGRLLTSAEVDEVAVGAVATEEPVSQVYGRILLVVLAAGGSQRFGQPKLALPWGDTTLLGHAVRVARASQAERVLVVLGNATDRLRPSVTEPAVQVVVNPDWATGLSTSVRAGLEAAGPGWSATVFMLADQPGITSAVIDALIKRHRRTLAPIVVPTYRGQRGNPALFDRELRDRLMRLEGDRGGRVLFAEFAEEIEWVEVNEPGILEDIDTPADYHRLRNRRI